jgi:hypothetical protein
MFLKETGICVKSRKNQKNRKFPSSVFININILIIKINSSLNNSHIDTQEENYRQF